MFDINFFFFFQNNVGITSFEKKEGKRRNKIEESKV